LSTMPTFIQNYCFLIAIAKMLAPKSLFEKCFPNLTWMEYIELMNLILMKSSWSGLSNKLSNIIIRLAEPLFRASNDSLPKFCGTEGVLPSSSSSWLLVVPPQFASSPSKLPLILGCLSLHPLHQQLSPTSSADPFPADHHPISKSFSLLLLPFMSLPNNSYSSACAASLMTLCLLPTTTGTSSCCRIILPSVPHTFSSLRLILLDSWLLLLLELVVILLSSPLLLQEQY
jgi:hypothetical protein